VSTLVELGPVRALVEERHLALAEEAGAFVRAKLLGLEHAHSDDEGRVQARLVLDLLREARLLRFIDPFDLRACCVIREALAFASPLADEVFALQCLAAMPILLGGSASQREQLAAPLVQGSRMAAFAMTERNAGSDVGALETVAVREGASYRIDGAKTLISNAGIADQYTVFAATDRTRGHAGLSCFVVPASAPGLRFVRPLVLSAPHPLGELAFEGLSVDESARIGSEGDGFKLGMATLDRLRPTVAAAATGMAARALHEALSYAKRRSQFGKPIAEYQLVQQKLAHMAMELTASRLLLFRAAWEHDHGKARITLESAMAKAYATEAAQRVIDSAVQIHGGAGVLAESVVDRLYRSIRALRIYEGTTEVQELVIARQLLTQVL
jgi:acyl-CoA dehydrogenase